MNTKKLLGDLGFKQCEQDDMWVKTKGQTIYVYCDDGTSIKDIIIDIMLEYEDIIKYMND